jgi:hypothetical protein
MRDLARTPGLARLLVSRFDGRACPDDVSAWAAALLERGFDTPNLRILGGPDAPADREDVDRCFEFACEELACATRDEPIVRRALALELATAIAGGSVAPSEGCRMICEDAAKPLANPPELAAFPFLNSGRSPEPPHDRLEPAELDAAIIREAEALRARSSEWECAVTSPSVVISPQSPSLTERVRLALRRLIPR